MVCEVGSAQSCGQGSLGRGATPGLVGTQERAERTLGTVVGDREQEAPATGWESSQRGRRGAGSASLGAAKVPISLGDWSLDLEKVCRALLFAQGALWSRAKAAARAGTVWTNTGTGEVPVHQHSSLCRGRQGSTGTMWGARGQEGTMALLALVRVCRSSEKTGFPCFNGKVNWSNLG